MTPRRLFRTLLLALFCITAVTGYAALGDPPIVTFAAEPGAFPLVASGKASPLVVDAEDWPGVVRAARDLQADMERVTGIQPTLAHSTSGQGDTLVIVGTLGRSALVDTLVRSGKIDVDAIRGQWEAWITQVVEAPLPGVEQALVIVGSDKRGTIYGIYGISEQIGVSPWHWWADVAPESHAAAYVRAGRVVQGPPAVKYRGIFINDEAPALRRWADEKFGGLTPEFYAHVFELLLRLRANYLWPAMWLPTSFNDDFPDNPRVADEYGIVMSTSHHEPMMRAHHEWIRYGKGPWDYQKNRETLQDFWRGGIERMGNFESVVTVGMRGDGDEAMAENTAVALLQEIIADQRRILSDVLGRPANEIPQVWALYKEVQDYYDEGMRVDDDILVLFSDDNWGNIRYLPKPEDLDHPGGYGMYYHVDYVGAPVSYRWLNTTQIERVWEQMTLTYEAGVRDLWIVNVGDIKPMELPISFFLELAWNPEAIDANDIPTFYQRWAAQQMGPEHAAEIAEMLALYTKYNARRTPEMLAPDTYSVEHYREADRIVAEYHALAERARRLYERLPEAKRAAYFQLVLFPIEACANLNEMYVAAGKNRYYGVRGAAAANFYAKRVEALFARDRELTREFHQELLGGKWNHMMSQTHIGYTYWNHPPLNRMPAVSLVQVEDAPTLGYFIEYGEPPRWGWLDVEADWAFTTEMPIFHRVNDPDYYIEVFNRGGEPVPYRINAAQDWIRLSRSDGTVEFAEKVHVKIDWSRAPAGASEGQITLAGAGAEYRITVPIRNESRSVAGFIEHAGVVSIEAAHFDQAHPAADARWEVVPNLGRTGSAVTVVPSDVASREPGDASPSLEYTFTLLNDADVQIHAYVSPTQDFRRSGGLRIAVAIDDAQPEIININAGEDVPDWKYPAWWNQSVADHIKIKTSPHGTIGAGTHTLRIWMVDAGIVLQKLVIDAGGLQPSYLGPPESARAPLRE